MKKRFYITTAIDYPNAKPHMGHAYEKIITDVLARWMRFVEYDVFFLTGLDEHGQKIQETAEANGLTPQEFVDKQAQTFLELCKILNLSNNDFIRTTQERHKKVALMVYNKLFSRGDIYLGAYTGDYCVPCETFFTKLQLINGNCPKCARPIREKEPAYFFKLNKYQARLIKYIQENPDFIYPEFRKNEILSRLKEPLNDLCISRSSFNWGIPLPNDPKHVMYVWIDALMNYLSGIDFPNDLYEEYWPCDKHVIGKDINWFHSVIWPCILMGAEIPLPKQISVHGFINDDKGEKMSKSKAT